VFWAKLLEIQQKEEAEAVGIQLGCLALKIPGKHKKKRKKSDVDILHSVHHLASGDFTLCELGNKTTLKIAKY